MKAVEGVYLLEKSENNVVRRYKKGTGVEALTSLYDMKAEQIDILSEISEVYGWEKNEDTRERLVDIYSAMSDDFSTFPAELVKECPTVGMTEGALSFLQEVMTKEDGVLLFGDWGGIGVTKREPYLPSKEELSRCLAVYNSRKKAEEDKILDAMQDLEEKENRRKELQKIEEQARNAEEEAKAEVEREVKLKAEEKARLKAEEEAKAEAEREAKERAEAEAKAAEEKLVREKANSIAREAKLVNDIIVSLRNGKSLEEIHETTGVDIELLKLVVKGDK